MITFKQYLSNYKKKYVCIRFTEETNKRLQQYATSNGFDLTKSYDGEKQSASNFDFHITVYFTNNCLNDQNRTIQLDNFSVACTKLELLGENKDIPVLLIEPNNRLAKIRQTFESNGYKDSWPKWKPHVSLSYARTDHDVSKIALPNFELVVDKLQISDQ